MDLKNIQHDSLLPVHSLHESIVVQGLVDVNQVNVKWVNVTRSYN